MAEPGSQQPHGTHVVVKICPYCVYVTHLPSRWSSPIALLGTGLHLTIPIEQLPDPGLLLDDQRLLVGFDDAELALGRGLRVAAEREHSVVVQVPGALRFLQGIVRA